MTESELGTERQAPTQASPALAGLGAFIGSLVGSVVGLVAGALVGEALGLPGYEFMNEPPGFDTLDAALVGLGILWLVGSWWGARLAYRTHPRPPRGVQAAAVGVLVALGAGTLVVGSAAADWYFPFVFFAAAPIVWATAATIANQRNPE